MSTEVGFEYSYNGRHGFVRALSFKQALDHAKVNYLVQIGYGPKHPKFRLKKAELRDEPFRLRLSDLSFARYKELYLGFREDQLSEGGKATLSDFQAIIKDKEKFNELHHL